jgi:exoribonuclease R
MAPSSTVRTQEDDDTEENQSFSSSIEPKIPTGKVVGVFSRNLRPYVATIQSDQYIQQVVNILFDVNRYQGKRQEKVLVVPFDRKIPKIRVATRNVSSKLLSHLCVKCT